MLLKLLPEGSTTVIQKAGYPNLGKSSNSNHFLIIDEQDNCESGKKKKKKQVLGCREQVQAFEVFFIIQKVEKEKTHNEYQLLKGRISMTEQFSFKKNSYFTKTNIQVLTTTSKNPLR